MAKAYVQEDGLRLVARDRVQRALSAASLRDDVVAACGQEHPGYVPEVRLVVDDQDAFSEGVGVGRIRSRY